MTVSPSALPPLRRKNAARASADFIPMLLGIAITLTLRGYQFGSGNHSVYLLAPLREVHPELFRNDWWLTHTLQYHWAFTQLTAALLRWHLASPVFLALYLALLVLLHDGWLRIARAVGLNGRAYLLSVLLYYLSAGGTGLGSYQFLQDSSFLPGNIANVAMLQAIACWLEKRTARSAAWFALASFFHLNHALIALVFWPLGIWFERREKHHGQDASDSQMASALSGLALILLAALPNILPALRAMRAGGAKMPLAQFVDLYVHLRHPHHYDPLAWPMALWLSFLWPIPLAIWAAMKRRAVFVLSFFLTLQLIAFFVAGVIFISEPLIQMSLFRFSIYAKLLSCIRAAAFILEIAPPALGAIVLALPPALLTAMLVLRQAWPESAAGLFVQTNLTALLLFVGLLTAGCIYLARARVVFNRPASISVAILLGVILLCEWNHLGLRLALRDDDDADYLALCDYARAHTPVDAVFVVPPNEQVFRYRAQRAIVINFKNVPQLSGEMGEWKERLETVLGASLSDLPRRFDLAHAAIAARYDSRTAPELSQAAARYGAAYVITAHALPARRAIFENASYHLYAVADLLKDGQMTSTELQENIRAQLGWRIGDQQARYILARLADAAIQKPFPILASDARTGQAIRPMLDPAQFAPSAPSAQAKQPPQAKSDQFLLFPM